MNDDQTVPITNRPSLDGTATMSFAPFAAVRARNLPAEIGNYRVLHLIGEGGMGSVFAAEQPHPRRIVALKVIRAGVVTGDMLRRFEQESQVLGRLQHPGIAQVYEAGTADNGNGPQPYFAMEFIQGCRLTEFVAAKKTPTRARLELMVKICSAVQHAHQRGIIHRDLKPGNILVDEAGQPKILDFGVARVTDADTQTTRQTDVGQLIGTLAYMSPEQVLADPLELDTRSDVYALGVILYELLSGRLPYDVHRKLMHEAVQAIREQEPAALSSINRIYRGDIETIVSKALEKDKARRYGSAAAMGADIQRYLDDEPIVARPASAAYQAKKFARRHQSLVTGVAAVFVALVLGIIASTWQAIRATDAERTARAAEATARAERDRATGAEAQATQSRDRAVAAEQARAKERDRAVIAEARARNDRDRAMAEKRRADTEAATARSINDFLQRDLLAQASSNTQASSANKPDPEIKVKTVLDRAAARIGDRFKETPDVRASIELTMGKTYEDLGLYKDAQRHFESALSLRQSTVGPESPESLQLARELGGLYRSQGKYADAESLLTATLEKHRRVTRPINTEMLLTMENLASVYSYQAKFTLAEPLLREAIPLSKQLLGPEDPTTLNITLGLAGLYFRQRKLSDAEPLLLEAMRVRRRTLGTSHPSTLSVMSNLGVLYQGQVRYREAEPLMSEVLEARRRVEGPEHAETLNAMNNLAAVYVALGKNAQAEPLYMKALEASQRSLGPDHPRTLTLMNNIGLMHVAEHKYDEAEAMLRAAFESRRKVLGADHPDTNVAANNLALLYLKRGNLAAAEDLLVPSLHARRNKLGADHADTAVTLSFLSELRLKQGNYAQAETLAREAVAVLTQRAPNTFRSHRADFLLGASLAGLQKYEDSEPLLLSGFAGMREKALGTMDAERAQEAGNYIVKFYDAWKKEDRAAEWRAQLAKRP